MAITEVRIHPAIGIARVGNSDSEFFIGPERPWDRSSPAGGYKDAQCRIKRQAARFRVFGYDNGVPSELTAANATIEWTVHLINRKAAAVGFESSNLRNGGVTGPARDKLVIDPGSRTLNGPDQHQVFDTGTFTLPGHAAKAVPLGEVRTDDEGRLLVLGGLGNSGSPSNAGFSSFADNDDWHDDVSDGPVTATVTIGGQTFTAKGAWVVVGPPKFAPSIDNIIRLWDAVVDGFVNAGLLQLPSSPSYTNDIYPVLQSAVDTRAVNSDAIGHHGFTHPKAGSTPLYNRLVAPGGSAHMPRLYSVTNNGQWDQRLTATQLSMMQKWSVGTVINDWNAAWGQGPPPVDPVVTPAGMDKAALENCVGGAFFPGIEASSLLVDPSKYLPLPNTSTPEFRLDHMKVRPGDVTAQMAVPWQCDFRACDTYWWPVPRPNQVTVAGSGTKDWARPGFATADFVTGKWNKLGFVTVQAGSLVETDRCDTAETWVSLVTPALTFHDVPQGPMGVTRKTARAIVFEVRSPSAVTLNVTAGPTDSSLSLFTPTPVTVPATGGGVSTVRLWVVYAAPNPGHVLPSDSVTVSCPQTGQTWVVPIAANAVPRKTAAVALVLDKSGSMSEDRGDGMGSKSQSMREAASTFLDVMLPGDSMSLTAFDDNAAVVRGLTALGDPTDPFDTTRSDMRTAINGSGLNPGGNTSIGDGIFDGRSTLAGAGAQVSSLVVLTDGVENRPRWLSDVAAQIDANTYSVGLGTIGNTSAVALDTIAGNRGGHLLITGPALGGDNQFLLKKYFLQVLAGVSNAEIVLDPVELIGSGQTHRVPFTISDADNLADVILIAEDRKSLQFLLETPSGHLLNPMDARALGASYVSTDQVSYYRVPLPLLVQPGRPSQTGTWNAVLVAVGGGRDPDRTDRDQAARAQRYSVVVHTWSDLSFSASAHQNSYQPGATVNLLAGIAESGIPRTADAYVWADVTRPDATTFTLPLNPQGDEFSGSFTAVASGEYSIRVRASGTTDRGNAFQREQTLSAGVWRGGDVDPTRGGPGDVGGAIDRHDQRWCALLRCVLSTLAGNDRLIERWREIGIDPRDFLKCMDAFCRDLDGGQAGTVPDELRRLVAELHRSIGEP